MQPYFIPYAGYFRLFAAADLFVVYDCVQFPRRGWVHRNRLPDAEGTLNWLTLPIATAPRNTLIRDLTFAKDGVQRFHADLRRFPSVERLKQFPVLNASLRDLSMRPLEYLVCMLETCCRMLELPFKIVRSSTLAVPETVRGVDRIMAIVNALGASRYVNAPGGRELYSLDAFRSRGIELQFLSEYGGATSSILHRLLSDPAETIHREITRNIVLTN